MQTKIEASSNIAYRFESCSMFCTLRNLSNINHRDSVNPPAEVTEDFLQCPELQKIFQLKEKYFHSIQFAARRQLHASEKWRVEQNYSGNS